MFERFDPEAQDIVTRAMERARLLGHNYVGCEHLLLAVASTEHEAGRILRALRLTPARIEAATVRLLGAVPGTLDADALAAIGIDLDAVRRKVEAAFGPNALAPPPQPRRRRWLWRRRHYDPSSGYKHIRFTPRAKLCLERSLGEARVLLRPYVGVEHIALALTSMTDGLVPQLFSENGTSSAEVRTALHQRYRDVG